MDRGHLGYHPAAVTQTVFQFPVAPLVKASLTIGPERLTFRQGLRTVDLALADIEAFAYRDRGAAAFGMTASELIVRHARGRVNIPFDLGHDECRQALAELRRVRPQADLTELPWEAAAARLGVRARAWYDALLRPQAALGVAICGASAFTGAVLSSPSASASERLGQGIAVLLGWVIGVTLIVRSVRATRRDAAARGGRG